MAFAKIIYEGDGVETNFTYPTELITGVSVASQIKVYVDTVDTSYTVGTGLNAGKVVLSTAPADGAVVVVQRETKIDGQYVTYTDNSIIDDSVLNQDSDQMFFLIQENRDRLDDAMLKEPGGTYWQGEALEIRNLSAATTSSGAVTLAQLNSAIAGVPSATIGDGYSWSFSGDASTTAFPLSSSPTTLTNVDQLFVSVSGVVQRPTTDFTLTTGSPATLNFVSAPPTGTSNILVRVITGDVVGVTIPDGSITNADLAGSITGDKMGITGGGTNIFARVTTGGTLVAQQPSASQLSGFDTTLNTYRWQEMTAPNADVNMGNQLVRNVTDGVASTDAATKGQLDAAVSGIGSTRIESGSGAAVAGTYGPITTSNSISSIVFSSQAASDSNDYSFHAVRGATNQTGSFAISFPSANQFTITGIDGSAAVTWTVFTDS